MKKKIKTSLKKILHPALFVVALAVLTAFPVRFAAAQNETDLAAESEFCHSATSGPICVLKTKIACGGRGHVHCSLISARKDFEPHKLDQLDEEYARVFAAPWVLPLDYVIGVFPGVVDFKVIGLFEVSESRFASAPDLPASKRGAYELRYTEDDMEGVSYKESLFLTKGSDGEWQLMSYARWPSRPGMTPCVHYETKERLSVGWCDYYAHGVESW